MWKISTNLVSLDDLRDKIDAFFSELSSQDSDLRAYAHVRQLSIWAAPKSLVAYGVRPRC